MSYSQQHRSIFAAVLPFRAELDERGLLPVDVAREVLRAAPPTPTSRAEAERVWASVLSLASVEELIEATRHLTWDGLVPGRVDTALVDRYGDELIGWIETRVRDGVLVGTPHVLGQCLTRLTTPRALELLLRVDGYAGDDDRSPADQRRSLLHAWVSRNAEAATLPLFDRVARLPAGANDAALTLLKTIILSGPVSTFRRIHAARGAAADEVFARLSLRRALTTDVLLRMLDDAAARRDRWPRFCFGDDDRGEYFGLRLILGRARDGDAWGLVIERLEGATPDGLGVRRFGLDGFGLRCTNADVALEITAADGGATRVVGPRGDAVFSADDLRDDALLPSLSSEPVAVWGLRRAAIRAYLERFPGGLWPAAEEALGELSVAGLAPLVVTTELAHVTGEDALPSESACYRSAVEALVTGDPARFVAGPSNTAWRLHATHPAPSRDGGA